jgi:hypothetical protein
LRSRPDPSSVRRVNPRLSPGNAGASRRKPTPARPCAVARVVKNRTRRSCRFVNVDGEYPLEALCPAHRPLPIGGRCLASLSDSACPGHNLCPVRARRCEHAVVPGQVRAGFWHQRDEARNKVLGLDKIAGSDFGQPKAGPKGGGQDARSNITCVVPSRYGVFSA